MSVTRRSLLRLLPAAASLAAAPRLVAGEASGSANNEYLAGSAYGFFRKMRTEITERTRRLKEIGLTAPDTACPFLDSDVPGGKETEQWVRYREGRLGQNQITSWTSRGLTELEHARAMLAEEEKKALPLWNAKFIGNNANAAIPPEAKEMIFEIEVQARKLAVILDISPSMYYMLPAVRHEIATRFPSARFLEINGCFLENGKSDLGLHAECYFATPLEERNPFDPKWFLPEIPQKDIYSHIYAWEKNNLGAMRAMSGLMEVDAIYWFCDFDDVVRPAAVEELEGILKKNKTRLYVHSVRKKAPAQLAALVRKTGGLLTRKAPPPGRPKVDPATVPELAVSPGSIRGNLNKVVKLTGIIDTIIVKKSAQIVEVVPESRDFVVKMHRWTAREMARATNPAKEFRRGRKFSATGRLISVNGGVPALNLREVEGGEFRFLDAGKR